MKTFLITLLIALSFSVSIAEDGKFTKKKEVLMTKFNLLYDSIYVKKVFHGSDSTKAVKRLKQTLYLFNK